MLLPKLPSFFKRTANQKFDYKPLYYDAEKERQEKRAVEISRNRTSSFNGNIKFASSKTKALRQSNMRILIIIIALFGLAYYVITF